ncbi:BLUF domain-containing protein [Cognatilysobacter bugurensis]|uniref:BLUF domain-containing protein n=1 Tax=Cognatilysobacter bugurensis TaxID=543356 RepID=A0A918W8X3_9GAMM|nr:BLUF domain-containing protein [Lysobacter bugurensis]GHA79354.1 hypothetical protein GCM10007067_16060 [Lysobacter bugurensis]
MIDALVYRSRAKPSLTETELELILLQSRVLNEMRGLTGALIKQGAEIVQYLEGPSDALDRTLARITASPHHDALEVLERASNVERHFDTWHMGFVEFQRQHGRATATAQWMDRLPDVREASARNAPLAVLAERWDAFAANTRHQ